MAKDHGAPEAGQLSRAWIRGRRDRKLQKSEQRRVRNWTVHDKMRGVLDGCPQALQEGFSILPILERERSLTDGCVRCSEDRENTANVTREHKFIGENRGNLRVEKFR